jgi:hypothetical protein
MTSITNNEEFYTLTVNGEEKTLPKMSILNRGLTKLNLSQDGVNSFNYETLSQTYEGENLPSEDELKAKGVEQLEYEATLPTREDLKASAKAKLIAGEALTEDEANTIVL